MNSKTIDVGLLLDFSGEEYTPLLRDLRSEIKAVVGSDAEVRFNQKYQLVNDFDANTAKSQYETLVKSDVDIILAFGPTNNKLITSQESFPKPTILFGVVNSDLIDTADNRQTSGVENFSYIVTPISYQNDLETFKQIFPAKKIGVIAVHGTFDNPRSRASLDKTFEELDASYELISYTSIESLAEQINDVDAVYLAEGFGISNSEMEEMATLFLSKNLPSFSSYQPNVIELGWLATNLTEASLERIFRRLALSVEAFVNGRNLSSLPVFLDLNQTLTVNFNTATRLQIPIRFSQMGNIDFVGNFEEWVADESYSLNEAVELALSRNLTLKASEFDVSLTEQGLRQSKSSYLPDFTATANSQYTDPDLARLSGGQNPEQQLSGNLSLSQLLYSEDSTAAISIQKNQLAAQREQLNTVRLDVILSTTQACFELLRRKNSMLSQAENLSITKRNLQVAQQNYDAGESSKADIFRFRSEMANNLRSLINAISSFQQAQYSLNTILKNPIDLQVGIITEDLSDGLLESNDIGYDYIRETLDNPNQRLLFESFLLKEALLNAPEVKALNYRLNAVKREMKRYGWRRYIPTVSANAQYNNVFDRSGVGVPDPNLALDDYYSVGLIFSLPLFNRNQDNINLKRAKIQYQQLEVLMQQQEQEIENRLRSATLNVTTSISNIELSKVSEDAIKQTLALIQASYATGAVTVTELIDAQNSYLQAQISSSNAFFDFIDNVISLERTLGDYFFFDTDTNRSEEVIRRFEQYRQTHQPEHLRNFNEDNT
ncbi:MAG: TolC family protein [Gammaproteobacteria bacterium]|nr:TolC family protein [Gammaproteobacteria bacterium]